MIDLTKEVLPSGIYIGEKFYTIHTTFRYGIMFINEYKRGSKGKDLAYTNFDFMYLTPPSNYSDSAIGFYKMLEFFNPKNILPRSSGKEEGVKVLDYMLDADLIFSAFYHYYNINLLTSQMHWYTFLALLDGLKDTKLNDVISARLYENQEGKKTKYSEYMEGLRKAWSLDGEIKAEEDVELKEFLGEIEC